MTRLYSRISNAQDNKWTNHFSASFHFVDENILFSICQAARALTDLGVKKGDRVLVYMPMIPEGM